MQKVVILTEKEYEELKGRLNAYEESISSIMNELDLIADDPKKLQEYVLEWLGR